MKWKFWEKPSTLPALVEAEIYTAQDKSLEVAMKIAADFLNGDVKHKLDNIGINELTVISNGIRVHIDWYSSGRLRNLSIDGKGFLGEEKEADLILRAAQERAKRLLKEELEKLHSKMFKEEIINGISSK